MEYIGKWKVKKTFFPTEEGFKHLTKEEIIAAGIDDEDALEAFKTRIEIKADGTIDTLVKIPDEMCEEAKAQGEEVDADGCIKVDSTTWNEKDGSYFYDAGGQEMPLALTEEGLLQFAMGMMLLERI